MDPALRVNDECVAAPSVTEVLYGGGQALRAADSGRHAPGFVERMRSFDLLAIERGIVGEVKVDELLATIVADVTQRAHLFHRERAQAPLGAEERG
jgi:hypothetical protein